MTDITTNLWSLGVLAEVPNNTNINFFVLPPVNNSNFNTTLHRITFYLLVYNTAHFNTANFAAWTPGDYKITNGAPNTFTSTGNVLDNTVFQGMRWFST